MTTMARVLVSAAVRVGLLLSLGAGGAWGQAWAQEARLAGRLPEPARTKVDSLLDAARAAALPTEPLVDRALEGAAKGAPPALIVNAVTRLLGELREARGALGPAASPAELTAGASALRAGALAADLSRLRERRPNGQSVTVAAAVLADLVSSGVPVDTAIAAVLALAGTEDAQYVAFRRSVQRDIALGASPAAALGVRLRTALEMADGVTGPQTGAGSEGARRRKP